MSMFVTRASLSLGSKLSRVNVVAATSESTPLMLLVSGSEALPCIRLRPRKKFSRSSRGMATASVRDQKNGIVPLEEAKRFMMESMLSVGTCKEHAVDLAELLLAADYRGHFSHGLNRLEMYVGDVEKKTCDPNAKPQVLKESAATAWVDGMNGLGPVVGNFCMQLAIRKAQESGIGWVVAKRSNHYGIAGWYSTQALEKGLLGMSFTNTSPLMSPTRAKQAALGTNPLSLAAPGNAGDSFVLDMATTAVAVGKIEVQRRKEEAIPDGWAQGPDGHTTNDADLAFNTGCLYPLGGTEITSGYKGYGLGLLVETFCGILGGSKFGPNIRKWMDPNPCVADVGQCFVAIDPGCFAPGFEDRMSSLMDHLRGMQPSDPALPVLVPGDPERMHMKKVDEQGGINYHENQIKASLKFAESQGIAPMKLLH